MPDHIHLLWLGRSDTDSDQRPTIEFLRQRLRPRLAPADWQRQPHDHVLDDSERDHGAFESVAHYVFENPVRAGVVARWEEHAYSGCCGSGYPELDVRAANYWERFWRCYNYQGTKGGT